MNVCWNLCYFIIVFKRVEKKRGGGDKHRGVKQETMYDEDMAKMLYPECLVYSLVRMMDVVVRFLRRMVRTRHLLMAGKIKKENYQENTKKIPRKNELNPRMR